MIFKCFLLRYNATSRLLANGGCIRVHIEQRSFASQNFDFCEVGSAARPPALTWFPRTGRITETLSLWVVEVSAMQ